VEKIEKTESRQRNRRGEGARLREEILAAATGILEETGSDEAVTLRSVARVVGIAAPSIYAHFPDREAIVNTVVDTAFEQLREVISTARAQDEADPVAALLRGCRAYVHFALERPGRYRILFGRTALPDTAPDSAVERRIGVFYGLVDSIEACVKAGRSDSTDPFTDATAIWCGMHGAVVLRIATPRFPWPPLDESIDSLVRRLGRIRTPRS
jgi:AcrR family transcriptional regulator